jgi:transglutaminase-like putative cysteine protease
VADILKIPRHCLAWLFAAQLALIAPHLARLPLWIGAVWAICAGWRILVHQGRWSYPGRWVKIALVIMGLAAIRLSYSSVVGLEPTVALLIAGFSFKLIEAATRREAYLLLFLGYFVAVTEFLFEQGLGTVLYMVLPVLLLTTALVALHQQEPLRFSWQPLRSAGVMSAQALPLMLMLFLVFPRIGPLWHVPLPSANGRTGMSDQMSPGDIANLSQSDALAFRAAFIGAVPAQRDLYWRGLVFDEFDGRSWRANFFSDKPLQVTQKFAGPSIDYRIYLEPTYQRWLYALEVPQSLQENTQLTIDYRLLANDIVADKFVYRARAYPQAAFETQIDARLHRHAMTLPSKGNPRTRAWAQELRERFADDAALIEFVLKNFRTQPFYYTLKPPLLGEDGIDTFLFDTRRGFCEHYASSFTFMLRAAGIPARVVVGYQGGEINPLTGTVLVHQFDAHAWAEAWLSGRGWVRFDPTAAVAPQRIEMGLERAVGAQQFLSNNTFSASRYRQLNWLNVVRMRIDAMNYAWTRWVVNYRDTTQTDVLRNLLGEVDATRMALFVVGGGGLIIFVVAVLLWGKQLFGPRQSLEQRLYQRFCARMAKRGYACPAGMGPGEYGRWLVRQKPQWRAVGDITGCFEALQYRRLSKPQRQQLLQRLRRLTRQHFS